MEDHQRPARPDPAFQEFARLNGERTAHLHVDGDGGSDSSDATSSARRPPHYLIGLDAIEYARNTGAIIHYVHDGEPPAGGVAIAEAERLVKESPSLVYVERFRTIAEEIASRFGNDGSRFIDDSGATLDDVCEQRGIREWRRGPLHPESCRFVFVDGSMIIVDGDTWRREGPRASVQSPSVRRDQTGLTPPA